MNRLARLTQLVGVTSVPVIGVVSAGWTNKTALALYWCETLMLIVLVGLRIHVHRRFTKRRGHYCEMLVKTTTNGMTRTERKIGHFGTSFVVMSLLFWLFSGGLLVALFKGEQIDGAQLATALPITALLMCAGFALDMPGIRKRPFAWIREMTQAVLWRVFLVMIVVIVGVAGADGLGLPRSALVAFVFLKLYTDVASQLPDYDPDHAPRWMVRLFGRSFAQDWRKTKGKEDARKAAEEEIFADRPMPLEQTLIRRTDG